MTVTPEHDAPRPRIGDGFSDAVTIAFGDARADLYGVARLGLAGNGASGLVILFHRGEPVAVQADGGVDVSEPRSWDEISAAGLDTEVVEPLREWRLSYASDDAAFDLELHAIGAIAELDEQDPVARAGGMTGYEQACRVTGSATVRGERISVDGLGQRGHSWGSPDWSRISLARTIGAWMGEDLAVSLAAIRPAGAEHHEDERVAATILDHDPESDAPRASAVLDPRVSTMYDADGRQRAAGLELYLDEDGFPRRAAGEVVCGTTLDLGRLRLDCAFFRWRMEGRTGFGRYDVLRRAAAS
ncbi:MAG: hypothetical protein QOJ21_336 [Solirubrobacteraceae bacterium]|jgi:hypothetical protein|nr:hypothetical protein [Solirubrobacteraceae bacterium]